MKIVKLGGSLLSAKALKDCLKKIAHANVPTVVVPGGGIFADQVRVTQIECALDERAAHAMAILAMQQMAWLMQSMVPGFKLVNDIAEFNDADRLVIWLPMLQQLDLAGIPSSWAITSDSLSAWLAQRIQADELLLIKSCQVPAYASIPELQKLGILDAGFLQFCDPCTFRISILNKDYFLQLA